MVVHLKKYIKILRFLTDGPFQKIDLIKKTS